MLEVQLLGKFEAKLNGEPLEIPWRPGQLLLAYLALNAGTSQRREKLVGLLWPDSDEAKARNNLRQTLWRVRKVVGKDYLPADKTSVEFNAEADYRLDVERLLADGADTDGVEGLIESVSAYQGQLLPGFYDDWVMLKQERLQAVFEDRMQRLLEQLIEAARWREVRDWAERWLAQGQVPEPAYRGLMTAAAGLGDQAGVAAAYQRCIEALDEEVGVEPSAETQALFERLTSGEALPQAKAEATSSTPPLKLPVQTTPFVGREDELARLTTLLSDPTVRLVTILGPGGMGKTRLSIEAARAKAEAFVDGVYFVSLAPIDDPGFISSQIAEALDHPFNVRDQREHWEYDTQIEQLLAYLKDKQLLLVLDNTEHLLATAFPALDKWERSVDQLAAEIIETAPGVKILTTSRERLNLHGETLVPLDGLAISDPESYPHPVADATPLSQFGRGAGGEGSSNFAASAAVELFRQGARRVRPEFELRSDNLGNVIDICRLVGGMPLGIELAAAWTELLSPAEIVAEIRNSLDFLETELGNIPDRQRSIRLVFESTWQRLTAAEQTVFQQLAVFRGGFSREAAQSVAGASLRTLMALVNKSLLRPDVNRRYQLHELLRQFAAEHLAQDPVAEAAARDRHCTFYANFLHQKETDLHGQNQGRALADIEIEEDNVRTSWQWAATHGKLQEMDQAMESLCEYYRIRGRIDEGFRFFDPVARDLGWSGVGVEEETPDSETMFNTMLHLLEMSLVKDANDNQQQKLLGKILARYNRFY